MIFQQPKNSFSELKWISNFFFSGCFSCCFVCYRSVWPFASLSLSLPGYTGAFSPPHSFRRQSLPFMNLNAHSGKLSAASLLLIFIEFFIITIRLGHGLLVATAHHCHCQCSTSSSSLSLAPPPSCRAKIVRENTTRKQAQQSEQSAVIVFFH